MRKQQLLMTAVLLILTGMMIGCVSSQKSQGPAASGFLKDYPEMTEGVDGFDFRYLKPGVDFSKYDKIMMDEVVFFFKHDAEYKGIKPSEIQELTEKFHQAFVEKLGDKLTDKSGPDVARMRLAVTDIEPSNPVSGAMTTVVPVGLAVSLIKKGATGEYTGIGSASAEVELLDSLTNERIAVGIDKAPGGKMDVKELAPVEHAFEYWAERLYKIMTEEMN